jgi:hypothetical protein
MAAISRDERSPNHQVAGTRNRIAGSPRTRPPLLNPALPLCLSWSFGHSVGAFILAAACPERQQEDGQCRVHQDPEADHHTGGHRSFLPRHLPSLKNRAGFGQKCDLARTLWITGKNDPSRDATADLSHLNRTVPVTMAAWNRPNSTVRRLRRRHTGRVPRPTARRVDALAVQFLRHHPTCPKR